MVTIIIIVGFGLFLSVDEELRIEYDVLLIIHGFISHTIIDHYKFQEMNTKKEGYKNKGNITKK